MTTWTESKRWADRYLPVVKRILGEHLICEAPIEEDQQRNTDLIVLRFNAVRIACRFRKAEYFAKFGSEFTIRASRPSGAQTELAKILGGWGDYMFYGFAGNTGGFVAWAIADLDVFRQHYPQNMGMSRANTDNSSSFLVFRWDDFPTNMVIASMGLRKIPAM